jgi:arylsulfatase A-like enzyme
MSLFKQLLAPLFLTLNITGLSAVAGEATRAATHPNVIVFLVDDMGWIDCGAYGSQYYETPNIDRFATRAMRFTDAYAQPLCSPTRASLLTGKYSARHGITSASGHLPPQPPGYKFLPDSARPNQPMLLPESKNYMEPSEYTLAEVLRDAGYRTAHLGKWHLGLTQPYWPEQQGFDVAFHCHPDPGPPGGYFSPYGVSLQGMPGGKNKVGTITNGPPGEYIVDRLADEAVKFIEANRNRPFFLNLWNYGVHGPWGHKPQYTKAFMSKKDPRGVQGNPIMASMLKSVDECFGRVLETLDRLGLTQNTIIVFNSDNGGNTHSNTDEDAKTQKRKADDPFLVDWRKWAGTQPPTNNAPLRDGKGTLYEGGTRVPLMWSWPGHIRPGTTSGAVVGHIDLYPTLLDLLGVPFPSQQKIDGISYAAVLTETGTLKRKVFFNYFPHGRSPGRAGGVWVRFGDWKLIRWFGVPAGDETRYELYNLRDDLGETKNLAAADLACVKELDALLDGFLVDTGATYPTPNPAYNPQAASPAKAPGTAAAAPVQGLVPKFCTATLAGGALRIERDGRTPFLGTTAVKHRGPLVMKLRARSATGGLGKVQWRLADQETFPKSGQIVDFALPGGVDWQEVSVTVPDQGEVVHVRVYLPAERAPVEIQSLQFLPADSNQSIRTWNFSHTK